MKKSIYICLVVLIILGIGFVIPKFLINEPFGVRDMTTGGELQPNGQVKEIYLCGGSVENPDILVAAHLDNPIQRFLTIKLIFAGEKFIGDGPTGRINHIYKAYTLFGIPVSIVELDCRTGVIQTVRGL